MLTNASGVATFTNLSISGSAGANTISFQDVTVQLQQYGILFKFSSKVESLYEDDIPAEMVKITGETMAEVLELVRYVRESERHARTPLVLISTDARAADRERGLKLGADAYITKPFEPEELLAVVRKVLSAHSA